MHTFQPYPVDLFEFNPFKRFANDWALLTAGTKEKVNSMTVSWGGVGSLWGKDVCFIFVRESRYTKEFIDNGENFSLTFFDPAMKKTVLKFMGAVSGRNEDKLKESRLEVAFSDDETPFIDSGNLVFLCKKMAAVPIEEACFIDPEIKNFYKDGDYHTMYVGELKQILAR